jgi:molybdenum cofactor synthesis domain-containing protein
MSIRTGILVISDRSARGERADLSGPALQQAVERNGWQVVIQAIVPDERDIIRKKLAEWSDSDRLDLVLTTGGTGFAPRDITPEATMDVIERLAPGLAESMRAASMRFTPHGMLSRAAAGIRRRCLIVNLPGSPKGAVENLEVLVPVLPHAIQLLREDPDAEAGHQK